ncbi:YetF domain-containing protein [Desulfosporosinus sp. SB140]|uniref:YetF domain-containing protein n=1 Tax=Desulfosporosinus paludis TaxID=3115649 RepID=UPI00388F3586
MYYDIFPRTLLAFFVLLILTRLLGKKQLSHLTFFNYITGITFGNIAASLASDKDIKTIEGLSSLILWTGLTIFVEFISLKSGIIRRVLNGEPTVVIKKGKIQQKVMSEMRLSLDGLLTMLRNSNVFSIKDVDYAVIETNGQISVSKKQEKQTVTRQDMNIPSATRFLIPTEIIVDGKILKRNLLELNISYQWVYQELRKVGINSVSEVLYAELESDGQLFIDKYENS